MNKVIDETSHILMCLAFGVMLSMGIILASNVSYADNDSVVDEVSITVPVSCTISGTGMNTHNATINNGQYNSAIGETTMKAFCNDTEGFAIYAIGYTDNTDGKNLLANSELGGTYDIETGTATSGNDSQWAMKLSTVSSPEPTYPIQIQNNFTSFQEVPENYTLVAKRTAGTDIGQSAEGSTLKSTYQAYISQTQPAGTYTGQVKYTLVHPNYIDPNAMQNVVTVVFDGNGFTFPDSSTTNTVKYANVCQPGDDVYVGSNYQEVMTPNISAGGTQISAYTDNEDTIQAVSFPNADRIKLVVKYKITGDTAEITMAEGAWNGWSDGEPQGNYENYSSYGNYSGTKIFYLNGDTATIEIDSWNAPESGYDYGFYVRAYPVYNTEQPGTISENIPSDNCSMTAISGAYAETTEWHNKWMITINDYEYSFEALRPGACDDEWCIIDNTPRGSLLGYISMNLEQLAGTTITVRSYNPVTFDEVYAAANKTKTNGYYVIQDLTPTMCAEVSDDEITSVIDIRDNNIYEIAKTQDNYCWLRDDLRLDPTNPTVATNMSSANTNATDEAIYNYLNGGNIGDNEGWSSEVVEEGTEETYTEPKINTSLLSATRGIDYNFCALSVGTYCYRTIETSGGSIYSLCPANWVLMHTGIGGKPPSAYGTTLSFKKSELVYWSSNRRLGVSMYSFITRRSYYETIVLESSNSIGLRTDYYLARCMMDINSD